MNIDDRLREFDKMDDRKWQRLIFLMRKHLDIWAHKHIRPKWGQVKLSFMPVFFNISPEGSTAMEISRKSMILKQTVSRTIKELEEKGMIVSKKNENDRRSELLELTPKGKQFALDAHTESNKLRDTYIELVGAKKLAIAEEVLNKIIQYHESQNAGEEQYFGD